jgi:hypothetical protein
LSHSKIAAKILEVMKSVGYLQKDKENKEQKYAYLSTEHALEKINEALLEQKLISKTEYEIAESKEKPTAKGAIWQLVTVSCQLTIIDTESDEILVNTAFGSGTDPGDKAVAKAQTMARKYAWLAALNIPVGNDPEDDPTTDTQSFVSVPPEQQFIMEITSLWQSKGWDINQLSHYVAQRFGGRVLTQLNFAELGVIKSELENYGR